MTLNSLVKREKLVFIWVILYIREYLFVFTNCLRVPGYPKIFNFGYPVPEIIENAQPYVEVNKSTNNTDACFFQVELCTCTS